MPKLCPTCNKTKELTEFNKNKNCKDGYQRECRECCHSHGKKHWSTKKSPRLNENLKEGHKNVLIVFKNFPLINLINNKFLKFY